MRSGDAIGHTCWQLWHGQVTRTIDLIGDALVIFNTKAEVTSSVADGSASGPRIFGLALIGQYRGLSR
jgi:hypothetical protein